MIESPSKCAYCGRFIFWREDDGRRYPVDARRYGDEWRPTEEKHFVKCPHYVKIREEGDCPAHAIEKVEDIDAIFKIDVDKPLCRMHSERGYFQVKDGFTGRVYRYSTNDMYQLRKKLKQKAKNEEKTHEKRVEAGDYHAMDRFVYEQG